MGASDYVLARDTLPGNDMKRFFNTDFLMHLSVLSPFGGGGGVGHRVGILTFPKKTIKIPTSGQKRIVKISRNKWFTSLLLYKTERSNA